MANDLALKKSNELNNANILEISALVTNQAPTANDDTVTGNVVGIIYINPETLLANDSDIDGDAIRGVSLQNAVNGEVHWDGTQVIFVPAAGYSGPASFEYSITDDKGGYDSATVNLNIVANSAPDAKDDRAEGYVNSDVIIAATELLANDTDADGDALIGVSLQDAVNGTVSWDGKNVIFTPDDGYEGPASFSYTITDGDGSYDSATVNLTIKAAVVDAIDDNNYLVTANESLSISNINLLANDQAQAHASSASVISVQDAVNGTVELRFLDVKFTPDSGYVGPASFSYTIENEQGSQDTATVNIIVHDGMHAQDDTVISRTGNAIEFNYTGDLGVNDIGGKVVSVQNAEHGSVVLTEEGLIRFTPDAGYLGSAAFSYTIKNEFTGAEDTANVQLDLQSAEPIMRNAVNGTGAKEYINFFISNDSSGIYGGYDYDTYKGGYKTKDHAYNFNNAELETSTTVDSFLNKYHSAYLNFEDDFVGTASFDFTNYISKQSAQQFGLDEEFILVETVEYNVVQNVPVTAGEDNLSGMVDEPLITTAARLLSNDSDPEGENFSLKDVGNAVNGSVEAKGGLVIFTPAPGYSGPASYDYTVSDHLGLETVATVNINVVTTLTGELLDEGESINFDEGDQKYVAADDPEGLLQNAQGLNPTITSYRIGDEPTVYSIGGRYEYTVGSEEIDFRINSDGSYSFWSYGNDYYGPIAPIHYTVRDDTGHSTVSTLNVTINNVNDLPQAETNHAQSLVLNNGQKQLIATTDEIIELFTKDVDSELTLMSVQDGHLGEVELIGNEIYFTPELRPADFSPSDRGSFQYTVVDDHGAKATGVIHLKFTDPDLTMLETNDDELVGLVKNGTVSTQLSDLLENDVYVNSDFDIFTSFDLTVQDAVNGEVSIQKIGFNKLNWVVLFTPDEGYAGKASFTYTINKDLPFASDTATVELDIQSNLAPEGGADTIFITDTQQSISVAKDSLLNNDSDPDNDVLTIVDVQNAQNGEVSHSESAVTFTPASAATDGASFDYIIADKSNNSSTVTVDVKVQADGNFVGTDGKDLMFANDEANTIIADAGNDVIVGYDGDDVIDAGVGDDYISGGRGGDKLTGGLGSDLFVWSLADTHPDQFTVDTITDFQQGVDQIDIKDLLPQEIAQLGNHLSVLKSGGNTELIIRESPEEAALQKIIIEGVSLDLFVGQGLNGDDSSSVIYE